MRNTIAVLVALFASGIASAQTNVLVNGDFETNSAQNFGNNTPISIAPWTLGPGDDANIVKVDGPGGYDYGNNGPESDASAPGAGVDQYYLDIVGENQFYQAFTPQCSGSIEFGGAFSTRADSAGTGSITIRQGAGFTGTIIGQTNAVNLPAGDSQRWTSVMFTVPVNAGQTYSFVVDMDNQVNFDNAFVHYLTACEAVDPCCPPWTTSMLEQVMYYQGTGSISAPYTLKYQPNAAFSAQMQAYINYLHSVNAAITQITVNFRLHDGGGNGTTPVMGAQLGSQFWVTWTAGGPAPGPQTFFTTPMNVNQWYVVHTGIYLEGGQQFFGAECADNDIGVRVQVVSIPVLGERPVLQWYRKGKMTEIQVKR